MASVDLFLQIDDEGLALQLQLEESEAQRELQSGKWTEDCAPDFAVAFDNFHAELKKAISRVEDLKLAHSIARAVGSDAVAIEESRMEEIQSAQDRNFALSLNEDGNLTSLDMPDLSETPCLETESVDLQDVLRNAEASACTMGSDDTIAGPSTSYASRQRAVLEHIPQLKMECSVCGEAVHPHAAVRLVCEDVYCKPCLKSFFLRVAKDESLFPPKCHCRSIDISTIEAEFSVVELSTYRSAEMEFTSMDRVYCASLQCAKFIPMPNRTADHASCEACHARTCMHCKALAHDGECPADEARQSLITFAEEQGWKSCFGCGEMVFRYEGCDHMTCRCGAQFCYRCGLKWKQCLCGDWEPDLLNRRAEQVVDREAPRSMIPAVRQQRVAAMARELQTNHECDHSGKFTKLEGSRRGRVCEVCGTRHWKYILSCKRCHMLACEDCRRHRL